MELGGFAHNGWVNRLVRAVDKWRFRSLSEQLG
jgi:hypothetical protein